MNKKISIDDIDWDVFEKEIRGRCDDYEEWAADCGWDYEYNPYIESYTRLSFAVGCLEEKDYEGAIKMALLEFGEGGLRWAMKAQ